MNNVNNKQFHVIQSPRLNNSNGNNIQKNNYGSPQPQRQSIGEFGDK